MSDQHADVPQRRPGLAAVLQQLLVAAGRGFVERDDGAGRDGLDAQRRRRIIVRVVSIGSVVLAVTVLVVAGAFIIARPPQAGVAVLHFPGIDWAAYLVMGLALAGLLLLLVCNVLLVLCEWSSAVAAFRDSAIPRADGLPLSRRHGHAVGCRSSATTSCGS